MVFVRMAIPEERTHLIEYGVVAVFIYEALNERANQCCCVGISTPLAVLLTALLGTLDECIQWLLPGRVFAVRDILSNVIAGVMAVITCVALRWARRWTSAGAPTVAERRLPQSSAASVPRPAP